MKGRALLEDPGTDDKIVLNYSSNKLGDKKRLALETRNKHLGSTVWRI